MATKKSAKRPIAATRKPAKKVAGEFVVELDQKTVKEFLGDLTASIERSNEVIARLGQPAQRNTDTRADAPANENQAVAKAQSLPAARPTLPSLEYLVMDLAEKCRSIYGFSCHLREQVQDRLTPEPSFEPREPSLKGSLEMAYRMLDAAHENLISSRNTIVSI